MEQVITIFITRKFND